MVKEISYVSINEILSRLTRHPKLRDITLEEVIQYVIDFIGIFGMPKFYEDKNVQIQIKNYRGILPCDYISIIQVEDDKTKRCLRAMSDTFMPNDKNYKNDVNSIELSFKTQGNVIFTSMKDCIINVAYKAIKVDKDGLPLLIDNPIYLKTLELYIKKEKFTILYDCNEINANVMQNTQQEYAFKAGQLQGEFTIPSISEMESITRMWNTLIPDTTKFDNRFKYFDREYIRRH